jgi:excisionase family DNA binding protein
MSLKLEEQKFFSISEACKIAGISRPTFLRWVQQGKFSDVQYRDRNGWRLFTEDDISRLKSRVNQIAANREQQWLGDEDNYTLNQRNYD